MDTEQKQYDAPTEQASAEQKTAAKEPPAGEPSAKGHRMTLSAREKTDVAKILGFAGALLVIGLVGLLFFLRPSTSEVEGRELTKFPDFTWNDFWDGSYFSAMTTWYADTFPGRDGLISVQHALEELYGIRTTRIIRPGGTTTDPGQTPGKEEEEGDSSIEQPSDGVYIKKDSAFEIYVYNEEKAERYAAVLRRAHELMPDVELYDIVVPLSYSVNMSRGEQQSIGASDAEEAIASIYAKMGSGVKTISILSELQAHKDEYLYFRTDHHWTARGAYYAYRAFCRESGTVPLELSSWKSQTFTGFRGSLWAKATGASLKEDYVEAWLPNATNKMKVWTWTDYGKATQKELLTENFPIIQTKTGNGSEEGYFYGPRWKYNCFIAGDNAFSVIENPNLQNGSKILVVKESFGNAFVPFLVDQYQTVYVVDYRFFVKRMKMSLPEYVRQEGIGKVLFLNNMNAISSAWLVSEMEGLLK
ncbi:MAG TPA: hypothetical protein DDW30_05765 [Clostridiales bacterium]|nr:hypothetical protein [Clostridiales bacterium]